MRGATAKVTNRQIRRAFGEEAIDTINAHGDALQSVVLPRLMTLAQEQERTAARLAAVERIDVDALVRAQAASVLSGMGLRRRLGWLLTGQV